MTTDGADEFPEWKQIYLSAGQDDAEAAEWLCARLEEQGLRCWDGARDRDPRLGLGQVDPAPVRQADVVIAVHSWKGDRRMTTTGERELAERCVPILDIEAADIPQRCDVPVLIEQIRGYLKPPLSIRVFVFAAEGMEREQQAILSLCERLEATLGARATLKPLLWDEAQSLTPTSEDVVIFLLWDSLYSDLPRPYGVSDSDAWMTLGTRRGPELFVYYKLSRRDERSAGERLRALERMTASLQAAVAGWLPRTGRFISGALL